MHRNLGLGWESGIYTDVANLLPKYSLVWRGMENIAYDQFCSLILDQACSVLAWQILTRYNIQCENFFMCH